MVTDNSDLFFAKHDITVLAHCYTADINQNLHTFTILISIIRKWLKTVFIEQIGDWSSYESSSLIVVSWNFREQRTNKLIKCDEFRT